MCLTALEEGRVIAFFNKCKNERSTECDDIDIATSERVIDTIAKLLTHTCKLSFQMGKRPYKMKNAKFIPLLLYLGTNSQTIGKKNL